ncbi:C40 family peptidase [Pedobacter sandarakinus]|uniref:C40 family peptidase n=1 Tax=Pedobacter sandarakinus TaxID=353156 RepID=UPI0022453868|nr:C40 family peptidase [Pedobacter sandarakinus]MCX2575509.1 C40 family peptidase [Pedobacter sandarakinus]
MQKLIFFVCFLLFNSASKAQVDTAGVRLAANALKKQFAPDKRSVYFQVQFNGDTVFAESTSAEILSHLAEERQHFANLIVVNELLPAKNLNGLTFGLANLSVCNNRAAPNNAAEMMTQMILGTPVEVLKKQGGYYLVRTPDGYLSYTDATAVSLMDKTAFDDWKSTKRIMYVADYGHAYRDGDAKAERVSDLVNGNILVVTGEAKNFYKVEFPDKRTGFVKKDESVLFSKWLKQANPNANAILNTAKTLIGVPYLWGGTSVKGVDCSGFTKTSYFLNGIVIPRDASQQALIGTEIEVLENDSISIDKCLRNLRPGDLLFFAIAKLRGVSGGKVTHTAIYMGDGEFIQAAGMVRVNSLKPDANNFDEREYKTLVGARRVLTDIGKPEILRVAAHAWYGR